MTTASNRTWMDRIRSAFQAQDETMLAAALSEAPGAGAALGGAPAIHIHHATADKAGEGTEFARATADALTALNTTVKEIGTKLSALDTRVTELSTKDGAKPTAEETAAADAAAKAAADAAAATKAADDAQAANTAAAAAAAATAAGTKTGDSAALASVFQDVIARGEILMPGVALPTFDAKAAPAATTELLAGFQRQVLQAAVAGGAARPHVTAVLPPGADLAVMTADSLGMAFLGASELAKRANNKGTATSPHAGSGSNVPLTPTQINEKNRAYWATRT